MGKNNQNKSSNFEEGETIVVNLNGSSVKLTFSKTPNPEISNLIKSALLTGYLSKIY